MRAGSRPYAKIWLTAAPLHKALFTLSMYADAASIGDAHAGLLGSRQDLMLGTVALHRIERDAKLPGLRALSQLPVKRINRYRPGRRLLLRLESVESKQTSDALDMRAPGIAPALAKAHAQLTSRVSTAG